MSAPPSEESRSRILGNLFRLAAWTGLIVTTGLLANGEMSRPQVVNGVVAQPGIVYRSVDGHRLRLDVYAPVEAPPRSGWPAVLAIHGGGWRGGSRKEYGLSVAPLARHGYVVFAVDYRLSRPGVPSWPENLDDVREAVRWVRRHASEFGVDAQRIVALGSSAGGHLAALLGTDPEESRSLGRGSSAPAPDPSARVQAVVDFYGPSDLPDLVRKQPYTAVPLELLFGGGVGAHPRQFDDASPVNHVTSDDPPTLIIHGRDDRHVPLEQSLRLDGELARHGVRHCLIVVDHARHGFGLQTVGRDLLPDVLAFLDSVWGERPIKGGPATAPSL